NAYLNEPDEESVFIHHGTPLPVQHYLFLELWNKTQSKELVKYFYPKLKAYYEFIAGKTETSNTANMQSGLIRTWDYFYNSGGWDDYPPQKYVNEHKLTSNVTPVVSSAHAIRIAKILKLAAHELGLQTDMAIYDSDIQHLSNALNNFSWDESSGYFGYVVHDTSGNVRDILKYDDQVNYNMGLGGASPLISGICTEDQKKAILSHLMTKGEIWSDVGLSAVDQSAPYYSNEGYWNGTVWMPHEWFYWKTMLDLGEANFADRIAMTALDTWKRETEDRYNCYEHFIIETGRGAGWHQFSGLSCPVLSWFNAYFQEGTITTGFDVWIKEKTFNESNTGLRANLYIGENSNSQFTVIVCLNPQYDYQVVWQGKMVEYKEVSKGTLSITLPNNTDNGLLEITKD
ncbi:MAG: hypothetical protein KDC53_21620, partial [Saprospiraceae bacterium]|nr:hypothetical protein [Saprospiraceae bacterium]